MKTAISRRIEWDMGHRIPDHQSLCRNPHGHRYVAQITVEGPVIDKTGDPESGMVRDFSFLKDVLSFIPNHWDHSFMVYSEDPFAGCLALFDKQQFHTGGDLKINVMPYIPTAENIAAEIFRRVTRMLGDRGHLIQVTVWETPNCKAIVRE